MKSFLRTLSYRTALLAIAWGVALPGASFGAETVPADEHFECMRADEWVKAHKEAANDVDLEKSFAAKGITGATFAAIKLRIGVIRSGVDFTSPWYHEVVERRSGSNVAPPSTSTTTVAVVVAAPAPKPEVVVNETKPATTAAATDTPATELTDIQKLVVAYIKTHENDTKIADDLGIGTGKVGDEVIAFAKVARPLIEQKMDTSKPLFLQRVGVTGATTTGLTDTQKLVVEYIKAHKTDTSIAVDLGAGDGEVRAEVIAFAKVARPLIEQKMDPSKPLFLQLVGATGAAATKPAATTPDTTTPATNGVAATGLTENQKWVIAYFKTHETDDTLAADLEAAGAGTGKVRDDLIAFAKAARPLIKQGMDPSKPLFLQQLGAPVAAAAPATGVADQTPAATEVRQTVGKMREAKISEHLIEAFKAGMDDKAQIEGPFTFFHTGIRVLSPYKVNGGSIVENSETKSGGFLEFIHTNVWAGQRNRIARTKAMMLEENVHPKRFVFDPWVERRNELLRERNKKMAAEIPSRTLPASLQEQEINLLPILNYPHLTSPEQTSYVGHSLRAGSDWRWDTGWDFSSRISFEFASDAAPSASTIAGSGDFSAGATLDKLIFLGWTPDKAYSVSFGVSASGVTESHSLRIHPRYLIGPSYVVSFSDPLRPGHTSDDVRRALFTVRVGRGYSDSVQFMRDRLNEERDPADKEAIRKAGLARVQFKLENPELVIKNANPDLDVLIVDPMMLVTSTSGVPKFSQKIAWGFEIELLYPLGGQSLLTLGARGDQGKSLALSPWSLYLGITTPLTKIVNGLTPK